MTRNLLSFLKQIYIFETPFNVDKLERFQILGSSLKQRKNEIFAELFLHIFDVLFPCFEFFLFYVESHNAWRRNRFNSGVQNIASWLMKIIDLRWTLGLYLVWIHVQKMIRQTSD